MDSETVESIEWESTAPNTCGGWVNQRWAEFETWPVIGEKRDGASPKIFSTFSAGLKTRRDAWGYAQIKKQLLEQMSTLTATYTEATAGLRAWLPCEGITKPKEADVTNFLQYPPNLLTPQRFP